MQVLVEPVLVVPVERARPVVVLVEPVLPAAVLAEQARVVARQVEQAAPVHLWRVVRPSRPVHLWRVARPSRLVHPRAHRSWMQRVPRAAPRPEWWIWPVRRSPVRWVAVLRSPMPRLMSVRPACLAAVRAPVVVSQVAVSFIPRPRTSEPRVRPQARLSMLPPLSRPEVVRRFLLLR